jgi:exonuclease III
MKILSLNCQGVASPSQKYALKRMIFVNQPDIVMLQETFRDEVNVVPVFECLVPGWKFVGIDEKGRFGGLVIGWNFRLFKVLKS